MIPPHLFYQIYISFLEQTDCTPPKCGEMSDYTDSAHTEVEDRSSICRNRSNVFISSAVYLKEGNVLYDDAVNTFYLWLYGIRHMVMDNSDSERENPLPSHRLLFLISSKGYFICIMPQTG